MGQERINPINDGFRHSPFVPPPPTGFTPVSPRPHTPARVHTHTHARARTRALLLTSWTSQDDARALVCTEHVARRLLIVLPVITWPTQPRVDTRAFVFGMWAYAPRSRASSSGQNVLLFVFIKCSFRGHPLAKTRAYVAPPLRSRTWLLCCDALL